MATEPQFIGTPKILGIANISTANANRDGAGTLGDVFTAPAGGNQVTSIVVQATVTTTAGMVRIFINDGSNTRLFDEFEIPANTVGANTRGVRLSKTYNDLILQENYVLKASTHNAETFNVFALGGGIT